MKTLNLTLRAVLATAVVALLGACGTLPPPRERPAVQSTAADPSTSLAKVVAASTPPGEHSGFRLMPLGVYSLDARIQLAQRAERSLVVQYYQLENDAVGRLLLRSLREAAQRGVKVRVLVDDLYTAKSQQLLLALSETPNVDVRLYNPFCCGRNGLLSRFVASPSEIGRLNHRMHNKLFIADGTMAVVGGRNIADDPKRGAEYMVNAQQKFDGARSCLPEHPNETPVESWLQAVRRDYWTMR